MSPSNALSTGIAAPLQFEGAGTNSQDSTSLLAGLAARSSASKASAAGPSHPPRWADFSQFFDTLRGFGVNTALAYFLDGRWQQRSYLQLTQDVERRARYLLSLSLKPQQSKVALISESHPEWILWALATMKARLVLVPFDARVTAHELSGLLKHSESELVIFSGKTQAQVEEALALDASLSLQLYNFDLLGAPPDFRDVALPLNASRDLGLIAYTSGTFAQPKGVLTSVRALLFQAEVTNQLFHSRVGEVCLSHLPMNHLYEFASLLMGMGCGCETVICERIDAEMLRFHFSTGRIQRLNTVPLLMETLEKGVRANVAQQPWLTQRIFGLFLALARFPWPLALRKRIFSKVHQRLGGQLNRVFAGGAPLKPSTWDFFRRLGLSIYQGYGLTETGPCITVQRMGGEKPGSVGPSLPQVEIKIADANQEGFGEVRTRGPHLMLGYYKEPALTAEAFDEEGFFRTGDIGRVDADGHLRLSGRIKKMIVLAGGKKVHAEEVEAVASNVAFVTAACAFALSEIRGENMDGVGLAVSLNPTWVAQFEGADAWARAQEEAKRSLSQALQVLSSYKRPSETFVLAEELPKTPTQKIIPPRVLALVRKHLSLL